MFRKIVFFAKTRAVLLMAYVMGFRFFRATTHSELDSAYHLRWEVYGDEEYINRNNFPDERLKDKYDDGYAISFLATKNGKPIASVRLIKDSPYNFPTENLFNIDRVVYREKVHEIARLVIDPEFRRKSGKYSRIVMFGLASSMYFYCMKNGIYFWLANMPEKLASSYKSFGAYFEKLPERAPEDTHLQAREVISGYFGKRTLHPYLVDIRTFVKHGLKFHY